MIKNQLYPYIESYLNEYLHGFTKDQLDIGVTKGEIKLENLNLRPDGINQKMDEKNIPFWLKAGLISKISIGCSIMNFIGEKPLDVLIEGLDIILNPSYKWIIKNIDSFIIENKIMMKSPYDPNDNNSMDIFTKKINVLDNSIFKKEYLEEIFKDKTRISQEINKLFKFCCKFYYQNNFLINLSIKNIHIRFEDDQLINYTGDLALGMKIDSLDVILSSEGIMKRDSMKVTKLCLYWEDPAEILIPSSLLNISIKDGKLDESYYTNLKKIKFQKFKYNTHTKFILQNFSFSAKLGIKLITKAKIDFFNKTNNKDYRFYSQFISNDLNFNFFPELMKINQNFNKFVSEFSVLEQVQDFKPMKKPYNTQSQNYLEFMDFINKNRNPKYGKNFKNKKKLLVRDWLFYFYWCQKCKFSLIGKKINPLRLEFSRFFNLCFNYQNEFANNNLNVLENNENLTQNVTSQITNPNINFENKVGIEDYNPDKINISYMSDIVIKNININLHPCNNNPNLEFMSIKINNIEAKINLIKTKFDFLLSCNSIIIAPSKLSEGEKVYISSSRKKREQQNINSNIPLNDNIFEDNYTQIINNIEENTGLTGLVNKYNPNYKMRLRIIDEAIEKIGNKNKLRKYAEFIIDPSKLKPGFYYAKVDIYNNYANVYETNKQCNFRKSGEGFTKDYLKKNRKIYIDEKLRTWIDGKITFPIGLYALEDSEVNRNNWLNSPFNIIYNQGKDEVLAKYLYEKSNHKLYSIIDLGSQSATKNTDEESIKKARDYAINIIKKYKNFEGIIGYYTIDEPPVQYSYSLMNISFAMREEDPDHFIITSIEDIYSLNVLKEGLDIVSLGCYPISNIDSLDCVSYVSMIGIKNMANAKANWGTIQIYDRTIEGKSGQNPPSELELKNMIYQNIAAGSMGLLAFDYGLLWSPKAKNPPQEEWDKIVKVFTEFKNIYSNIVYYVDEEPRYTYYFPEFIYQIPRGENVLARIWKKGHYDYILLVNMDKDKKVVNYKFKKPSPNTCIEIMSGTEVSDISMDNSINVNINIPHIGVVWLRGYDNDNICNKAVKVDPENLPKRFDDEIINDGNTFTIIIIIISSLFFAGIVTIVIFLWIKKKLCFASKLNMDDIKNEKIVE